MKSNNKIQNRNIRVNNNFKKIDNTNYSIYVTAKDDSVNKDFGKNIIKLMNLIIIIHIVIKILRNFLNRVMS
jgi:hypothetical protein